MRAISALGDAGLLLPASLALLAYLALTRRAAASVSWAIAVVTLVAATIAAKLAFTACGPALPGLNVSSPSGHMGFATLFYGALALFLATDRPTLRQRIILLGTVALLILIGASRVATGAHTPAEVVFGLGIGGGALGLFAILHRRAGRPALPARPLVLGWLAAVLVLGGTHLSLEPSIGPLARRLSTALDVCAGYVTERSPEGSVDKRPRIAGR
jgi:membrane-associated phospholipid phosphatase